MGQFSLTHLLILAILLLIFFGPNRLPKLGQGIGRAIRGFKDGLNGSEDHAQQEIRSVGSNRPNEIQSPQSSNQRTSLQKEKDRPS